MTFADNPEYKEVYHSEVHGVKFYAPANGEYNMSRYAAAGAQNIFSAAGMTKDLITSFLNKMLDICNEEKNNKRLKTDIAILCNNLLYRTKYPVDEDCAIRMGAIYTFIDGENPDKTDPVFTAKKLEIVKSDPYDAGLYAFFLTLGAQLTPAWNEPEPVIIDWEYLMKRADQLKALMPIRP